MNYEELDHNDSVVNILHLKRIIKTPCGSGIISTLDVYLTKAVLLSSVPQFLSKEYSGWSLCDSGYIVNYNQDL